ncbi:MAG: carbon starvation protein A [Thermodesulfovibrionales bacterium]|nr:carbon starvation protein A [Thermodesulfovibrionales bacterium]
MKRLSFLIWIPLAILFSLSFAIVTGIFNPREKINAIWLITAAACFYILAYRFYGAFLAAKVATLNDLRVTPAYRLNDGKNFYPTNKWVLFGHHFAAIAGAGPLIGPVLASQFGYLPGFLWILVGAALAGGVHDFVILTASMRRDGKSLAQMAKEEVGLITGGAALIAILFILIVAIAGLGLAVINSLFYNPWGTFIIGMTIPIAFFMGIYMKSIKPNKVASVSFIGITLLFLTVIFGRTIPSSPLASLFNLDKNALSILLASYGFVASVLPVWMLLAPRDYLSSFMKIGVIFLLALGVLSVAPDLNMPPLTRFVHGGGPIIPGALFPFVFTTIACGAISGFHSLISSGTTPKMIERERYARPIGYGAMLMEGFVAVMALIAAAVLIPGDYFAINTRLSFSELASLGFPVYAIRELSSMIGVELAGRPGGAVSLAVGMAYIFSSIPFLKHLMAYWYQFALMFEALFILTTIDAGTRVARYVVQELGGYIYKPFGDLRSLSGNIVASFIVVFAWGYFIYTGSISTIWPMFGTANQLLGMLALCIGTTLIIKMGKAKYIWVTLLPMLFMASITFTASLKLIQDFTLKASTSPDPFTFRVNAFLMGVMLILAVVIVIDSAVKWYSYLVKKKPPFSLHQNL